MIGRRSSVLLTPAALILGAVVSAPAGAQDRFSVDASVAAGLANNPFLQTGDTPTAGSVTVSVSPSYRLDTELTSYVLNGDATFTNYFNRYRDSDSYTLNGSATHRLSERSRLSARLGYLNSVVGAFNDLGVVGGGVSTGDTDLGGIVPDPVTGVGPVITTPIVTTPVFLPDLIIDPSLGGIGRRRQNYTAGAGYSTGLGPRDQLVLDLSVSAIRSGGRGLDDFNYVTQRVGYRRSVSEWLTLTADVAVGKTDYLGRRVSDATTIQPTVGVAYRLNEDTSLNLAVGVSVVRTDLPVTGSRSSTPFSLQGSLCKQDARFNACFSASRNAVPSSFGGVRVQNAVSASGGMRVSERGSASVSVSYSRSGEPLNDIATGLLTSTKTEYLSVRGGYNHVLSRRLSGFVSVGASKVDDDFGFSRDASVEARVGVRVRFGAL